MTWVKMDDKRALHPKLCEAGFAARGLDEAAIELCASEETDGFISDKRLLLLGGAHGESPKGTLKLVAVLIACDRWTRNEEREGHDIRDYLHYNPSHAELEAKREADRKRKRRTLDSDSEPDGIQEESDWNPDGFPIGSSPPRDGTGRDAVSKKMQCFDVFWDAYPRKEGKLAGRKAFAKALTLTDAQTITAGALRFAADPNREAEFTPHPASWLNAGRWEDAPLPARNGTRPLIRTTPKPCVGCGKSLENRVIINTQQGPKCQECAA